MGSCSVLSFPGLLSVNTVTKLLPVNTLTRLLPISITIINAVYVYVSNTSYILTYPVWGQACACSPCS